MIPKPQHNSLFASQKCPDWRCPVDYDMEFKLYKQREAAKDNAATHDIKTRVHRNLTEKTKFDAGKWLEENKEAYRLFKQFTLQAIESGVTRLGAKAVAERVRWESSLRKNGNGPKINNNAVTAMALKVMEEYPEYAGIFATRKHQ